MLWRRAVPSCWALLSLVAGTFACGHWAAEFAPHPLTRGPLAPGRVCSGDGGGVRASLPGGRGATPLQGWPAGEPLGPWAEQSGVGSSQSRDSSQQSEPEASCPQNGEGGC